MPTLTITSITPDEGSWLLVTAEDEAFIPRRWSCRMSEQEIKDKDLSLGLEIQWAVNGVFTAMDNAGCVK